MRLKTQLAIQAHIEGLPPRAWSRKDFQELLAEKRGDWNAPQYLTSGRLITFLLDNVSNHLRTYFLNIRRDGFCGLLQFES